MKDFFISYSWADADIVRPIAEQLLTDVPSIWFDHREMNAGDYIPKEIRTALQNSHTVLLMWSKHSHVSRWSRDERNAAILLGKRIIPCLLDDTPLPKPFQADDIIYLDFQKSNDQEKVGLLLDAIQHRFDPKSIQRPEVEKIPFRRNPNFIGRGEPLKLIESHLSNYSTVAIAGLGGVGKTELIVEYLFQHASEYNQIFWLRAEGAVTLAISFANIAHSLNLPAKDEKDQEVVIQAVIRWLEQNDEWLLVFDNAQELNKIRRYLPNQVSGHILITSRNDAWGGVASVINLEEWPREEAIQFLLKRLGQDDTQGADGVADALGNLPLALEQAGAYMEAKNVSLANYKKRFLKERKALLERGDLSTEYPDNISTTWEMAFREVKRESGMSLVFMKLCAFLAPEPIPIDDLLEGAQHAPDGLADAFSGRVAFEDMYGPLLRYSLIRVENDQITIHRLVQAVTQDRMTEEEQQKTAESVVRLVAHIFPPTKDLDANMWPQCQRWLSHAYAVTSHAEYHQVGWQEVSLLTNLMGRYLTSQADYTAAEPLIRNALKIVDNVLGWKHSYAPSILINLANLLTTMGKYLESECLGWRALEISERSLGVKHPDVGGVLLSLSQTIKNQGRYAEALPLCRRALEISKESLGKEHIDVATVLNNLASLLHSQRKYNEAEPFYRQSLKIYELNAGKDLLAMTATLNNLAMLFKDQRNYTEAETLYRRVLEIREVSLNGDHPAVATVLNNLASLLHYQGKLTEAELLYRRALKINEGTFGRKHQDVGRSLYNLAMLLMDLGKFSEAELLGQRALKIYRLVLGNEDTTTIKIRKNVDLIFKMKSFPKF